eukprot:jgi/Mesen1/1801/ME000140S00759
MGFIDSVVVGFCAGVTFVAGLQFLQRKKSQYRLKRAGDLAALARANADDLRRLIPKDLFPTWVQFPEFERVNWLNQELRDIWPFLNKAASVVIRESLEPVLDRYCPPVFASIRFQKLTLGNIAPQFGGIKIVETDKDEVVMEVDFKWGGNPSIILAVQTYLGVSLPVQVKDIAFFGVFRIAFAPLLDTLPCVGAITVALSQKPHVDFALHVVGGDVSTIPGLSQTIEGLIRTAVTDSLLWPSRHVIPIVPGDYSHLELHKVGLLVVKLVEARGLVSMDLLGKCDPFGILYVRPIPRLMKRSKIKGNIASPIWNEEFELDVEDPASQRLVVSIMDDEGLQQSQLLGEAALPLRQLEPGELLDTWLPLVKNVDEPNADFQHRGEVHLEVMYHNFDDVPGGLAGLRNLGVLHTATGMTAGGVGGKAYQRGILSVTVHCGTDLVARDLSGSSDPYVTLQLQLESAKKRTKMKTQTLDPIFEETFDFLVEDAGHDMLMIEVWDHDIFGKDFMGRLALTLTKVLLSGEYTDDFTLNGVERGILKLTLRWKELG